MSISKFDLTRFRFVIGIDFGTTFSYVRMNYEPHQTTKYPKTPTLSLYGANDGLTPSHDSWGQRAFQEARKSNSKGILLQKFKLRLDENLSLDPMPIDVDVVHVIADYLRCLYRHVSEKIISNYGYQIDRDMFRFCLTVPAMWSDRAKDAMRQAAILAGLVVQNDHPDRLLLVTEPEAAALYCQLKCKQFNLEHGDQFMVCDAGGGTVDLIVYEIEDTADGRRLSEVTQGHGASCGSIFIDQQFQSFLEKKFGTQGLTLPNNVMNKFVDEFISKVKPDFSSDHNSFLEVPRDECFNGLQDKSAIGIHGTTLVLQGSELKEHVFEPVVTQVIDLIHIQLQRAQSCKNIFLVGGFGSSEYLQKRIRDTLRGSSVVLFIPPNAEMAVVRGAVYAGLELMTITSRFSRRGYGVHIAKPFEEGVDSPLTLKSYPDGGRWCLDRFDCLIKKGARITIDESVCIPAQARKGVTYNVSIYAYDRVGAPPRYITDQGVSKVGDIPFKALFDDSDPDGSAVDCLIRLFFGRCEIRVIVAVQGEKYTSGIRYEGIGSH
ncbi:Heat shock 70 kDa protein 12A [Lunasporangiospora selenospora]|uniref:Heat shock 70 kDa protein 12A n=1 Tax=Lunasporangiospora selenospora TaxID=979761 RepID=A0A9P6FPB5_9FUNG|nr:Heat shock 70 kDa protein 12A [Lunasporangiospora selenospora]